MPETVKEIIQTEVDRRESQANIAAAKKEVAKAKTKLEEAKANLVLIEKESKGGK